MGSGYLVVAPDQIGWGKSPKPCAGISRTSSILTSSSPKSPLPHQLT